MYSTLFLHQFHYCLSIAKKIKNRDAIKYDVIAKQVKRSIQSHLPSFISPQLLQYLIITCFKLLQLLLIYTMSESIFFSFNQFLFSLKAIIQLALLTNMFYLREPFLPSFGQIFVVNIGYSLNCSQSCIISKGCCLFQNCAHWILDIVNIYLGKL